MIRPITILFAVILFSASILPAGSQRDKQLSGTMPAVLDFPRFGKVIVYNSGHPQQVVLFLSGESGWNNGLSNLAQHLATSETMVVGVDIRHYIEGLRSTSKGCAYPAADLEDLSKFIQKSYDSAVYRMPYLTGYSAGATLAYVAMVQAPSNTFSGAIGIDFCPEMKILKSFCKGSGLESKNESGTFHFAPAKSLEEPWVTLQEKTRLQCDQGSAEKYTSQVRNGRFVQIAGTKNGDTLPKEWGDRLIQEFSTLFAQKHSILHGTESVVSAPEVKDLPLIELPVNNSETKTMAVIVSGDGGWASIDREIGNSISEKGVPVVGWNSLQYFWKKRTPENSAKDLQRILQHYLTIWKKENAILIGYSFGADVLPFMVNRLPAELQAKVKTVSLLGLDTKADFEFHVADWINASSDSARLTQPEVEKIGSRVLCFYGQNETDSPCTIVNAKMITRIQLSGGHHFGGDYQGIATRILAESSR
jgi:type IV secretory pathway VirJ component